MIDDAVARKNSNKFSMNYPIYVDVTNSVHIDISKREVKRYLGYGRAEMTDEVEQAVDELILQMKQTIKPKACYTRLSVEFGQYPKMNLGFAEVCSEKLWKNLEGCEEIFVFAATVGPEIDRQIRRYARVAPSKSVILQAIGTAAIEAYCDLLEERIRDMVKMEGWSFRPRFSPGYGDFELAYQRDIFRILEPPRKAGITLTEQLLMVPEKSVTAVIGINRKKR